MKEILRGAIVLTAAGILTKALGAVYRIPLTNALGAEGLGAYQMVFPLYCAMLTVSSTGIPTALSKLIAEGGNARAILNRSLLIFGGIGLALSAILFALSGTLAELQGNGYIAPVYKALSPSIFFVSLISCFRGYYQGNRRFAPTAVTQITEQAVKIALGLTLAFEFGRTPYEKAALATIAVSASELIALLVAIFIPKGGMRYGGAELKFGNIVKTVFPVTIAAVMIPLSRSVDGFLVVNLIKEERSVATSLYGLYGGATESIISLPVALSYAFASTAVPEIAADKTDRKKRFEPLALTLVISAITGLLTYLFARYAVNIIYSGLSYEHKETVVKLVRIASFQIAGLSLVQTCGAVLVAMDKPFIPPVCLATGVAVKIALSVKLIPTKLGIYSCALTDAVVFAFVAAAELSAIAALGAASARKNRFAVQTK